MTSHDLVLIGGAGFIGRNILDALSGAGDTGLRPVVIDDLSSAAPGSLPDLPVYHGRYQDPGVPGFLDSLGGGPRILVLLAGETRVKDSAERPLDFITANVLEPAGFALSALRPGDHLLMFSTAGALFDGTAPITEDLPVSPKNVYGASKAAGELVLAQIAAQRDARLTVLRPTNVYGPHSQHKKSAIHAFVRATLAGQALTLHGDGEQSRDFVYAPDLARAVTDIARALAAGHDVAPVQMLASGQSVPLNAVLTAITKAHGSTLEVTRIAAQALLATEPRDVIADQGAISPFLAGQVTGLDAGIAATYDWYAHAAAGLTPEPVQ